MATEESQKHSLYALVDGKPVMRHSFLIFIDILGYREMIAPDIDVDVQANILERLHRALHFNVPLLTKSENQFFPGALDWYAAKIFTDNIVMARPLGGRMDGEVELGHMMLDASAYQFALALEGFFVRGGIAVGPAYVDDLMAFGPALEEAYALESKVAGVPRIVLSDEACEYVKMHVDFYSHPTGAPQNMELLVDEDGKWFVNYLDAARATIDDEYLPAHGAALEGHRDSLLLQLKKHAANRRVLDKYQWVGRYHNYVVNYLFPDSPELKVPTKLVRPTFKRLSQTFPRKRERQI